MSPLFWKVLKIPDRVVRHVYRRSFPGKNEANSVMDSIFNP